MSFPLLFGDPEADRYLKLRYRVGVNGSPDYTSNSNVQCCIPREEAQIVSVVIVGQENHSESELTPNHFKVPLQNPVNYSVRGRVKLHYKHFRSTCIMHVSLQLLGGSNN